MKNKKGFTLMEMMVVVLIIAGLAAVAYPTYSTIVTKARIAEALSLGEIVREAQQRALSLNGAYLTQFSQIHVSGGTRLIKSADVEVNGDGTLQKQNYKVTLLKTSTGAQGACIQIDFNKNSNGNTTPIFTVYMHVEDDRIGCTQATGVNGVCEAIPSAENGNIDCVGRSH